MIVIADKPSHLAPHPTSKQSHMLGLFPTYLHLLCCLLLPKPCKPCNYLISYTPEASYLALTSPISLILPQTSSNAYSPGRICQGHLGRFEPGQGSCHHHSHGSTSILEKPAQAVMSAALTLLAVAPKKPKTACGQFAYTIQAVW